MLRNNSGLFIFTLLAFVILSAPACSKDMAIQNKLTFQNHVVPPPPVGTITTSGQDANGASIELATTLSIRADQKLLKRGQERYNIHCTPCHDSEGDGHGLVTQRGFPASRSLSHPEVRKKSDQDLFRIISFGYQSMAGYREFISTQDRIAIVGYIRVLQLAKTFSGEKLDSIDRDKLEKSGVK